MKKPSQPNKKTRALKPATATKKFLGTDNPRELRAIHALMRRPMPREHIDVECGCSNGPDLIARLRAKGLQVPCEKVPDFDRDGSPIRRGVYSFQPQDRIKVIRWQTERQKGTIDPALAGLLMFFMVCAVTLWGKF